MVIFTWIRAQIRVTFCVRVTSKARWIDPWVGECQVS